MLRSLLWMASACASLFFLVRLKNSDTVNSFTLGISTNLWSTVIAWWFVVDANCGGYIYRVFYNSNGNFVVVLIYMYNQSFISL
jgi:hypothetical protein